jgi:hypothetical protein
MCNGIPAETSAGFGHVHQVEFLQLCGNHIGWYERGQQRCETKPGQYTTCYRYTGDTRTNNIAHTQVFRCNFTTQAGSGQVLAGSAAHPHWSLGDKMEYFLEHGIAEGEAQALIGRLGEIAALCRRQSVPVRRQYLPGRAACRALSQSATSGAESSVSTPRIPPKIASIRMVQ